MENNCRVTAVCMNVRAQCGFSFSNATPCVFYKINVNKANTTQGVQERITVFRIFCSNYIDSKKTFQENIYVHYN